MSGHICPVCGVEMTEQDAVYSDSIDIPTSTCPECNLSVISSYLDDDNTRKVIYDYSMRMLLDQVLMGVKAKEILDMNPMFPGSRKDQLIALMTRKIPPIVEHRDNQSLPPMSEEDIDIVKKALDL